MWPGNRSSLIPKQPMWLAFRNWTNFWTSRTFGLCVLKGHQTEPSRKRKRAITCIVLAFLLVNLTKCTLRENKSSPQQQLPLHASGTLARGFNLSGAYPGKQLEKARNLHKYLVAQGYPFFCGLSNVDSQGQPDVFGRGGQPSDAQWPWDKQAHPFLVGRVQKRISKGATGQLGTHVRPEIPRAEAAWSLWKYATRSPGSEDSSTVLGRTTTWALRFKVPPSGLFMGKDLVAVAPPAKSLTFWWFSGKLRDFPKS